jgi:hypothetical protein
VAATSAATTTARQCFTRKVTGAQESGDCETKNDIPAHAIAEILTAPLSGMMTWPDGLRDA